MHNESRGIEWKVGLFIAIGLAVLAFMAVKFGKLGTGLEKFYRLQVEFPNASGLLKGGEVYLAGARVGFAEQAPMLIEGRYAVLVPIRIREGVKIPKGSKFIIGSSGPLMGDFFMGIQLPDEPNLNDLHKDGDYIIGTRQKGLSDLTADSSSVIEGLKKRIEELEGPIKGVDEVLSVKNREAISEALANARDVSANLKATSKDLDQVVTKAKEAANTLQEAMDGAKGAMGKINEAADELKPALADFRKAAQSAAKAVDSARLLLSKANSGQGALGLLLSDRETAENLKSLIRNLKERGVLFYKDKPK